MDTFFIPELPIHWLTTLEPFNNSDYKTPIMINDSECLMLFYRGLGCIDFAALQSRYNYIQNPNNSHNENKNDFERNEKLNLIKTGIYKYNMYGDELKYFMDSPVTDTFKEIGYGTKIAVDINNSLLYSIQEDNLMTIDLNTKAINEYPKLLKNIQTSAESSIIAVNKQLHIIGSRKCNIHWMFDLDTKSIQTIYEFQRFKKGFYYAATVYIKSQNIFLLIGGIPTKDHYATKNIWAFSLKDNKWNNELYEALPDNLTECSCFMTQNDKYLIVMAGKDACSQPKQCIYILDIRSKKWIKSDIACPKRSKGFSVGYNKERAYLLVYGFVQKIYENFPKNLIEEIFLMYLIKEEIIHIVKGTEHYQIELRKLLEKGQCIETHHDGYRTYHKEDTIRKLRSLKNV
eukprot:525333_1